MADTRALSDFILPVPPIATGDAALDALLDRLESEGDEEAAAEIASRADGGPALFARLEQLAASVRDVEAADQVEASVAQQIHAEKSDRFGRIEAVALEAVARLTPEGEATMLRIFEEHPWSEARQLVGSALVPVASPATLARMAKAMDDERPKHVWVRDVGTGAAVRLDPTTAYDRLAARFEPELTKASSYFVRGLFSALAACPPVDPRWYPFIARFYAHREAVMVDAFFKSQPVPAAVDAVAAFIAARAASGEPWIAYVQTLHAWGSAGWAAGPAVVAAASAALDADWSDWRFVGPLNALVAMDDPAVLPALRALAPKAKRKAKTALEEAIKKLARNEPPDAAPPKAKPKAKAKPMKALDPERAHLATLLSGAGFSERRVDELVALAWPRITLEVKQSGTPGVGTSRLGGSPDLPPGTEWPVARLTKKAASDQMFVELSEVPHALDGKHVILPLGFVAQLRLEELAPFDPEGRLPKTGLLSFFARQDVQPGEHGGLFRVESRVLFHESVDALVEVAPLSNVLDRDRHEPRSVVPTRELPLAPPQFARALGLVDDEAARYDALYAEHVTSSGFGALGRARAAYFRGLPGKSESLLLQCVSDEGTSFTWGDESSIFFLIADAALKTRDFARSVCVADEL